VALWGNSTHVGFGVCPSKVLGVECYKFKEEHLMESAEPLDYQLKNGFHEMDFARVTGMLTNAFWCRGIKIDEVKKGAANSALVVGAFLSGDVQIGFARVVSDKTRFAYILDVIVDDAFQRVGVGQAMMRYVLSHPELKDVYQWFLLSSTAREVYRKVGFKELSHPEKWMEIKFDRPAR
jgi:ribosomal protein S18 acetylase RimI-like enzyme